jgi:hypothetical protein
MVIIKTANIGDVTNADSDKTEEGGLGITFGEQLQ